MGQELSHFRAHLRWDITALYTVSLVSYQIYMVNRVSMRIRGRATRIGEMGQRKREAEASFSIFAIICDIFTQMSLLSSGSFTC
ncbi:hypothetical protein ccbrp13_02450 [Ktedonobacteria bacterium brp13]|nr:hypothetical protein ccbrp13_02450 [Ktedonobacteria bacterium brp13]